MYTPKHFQVKDSDEVIGFIKEHSFATIVTVKEGMPIATHIPVQVYQQEDEFFLTGHVAYGNSQWRTFETTEKILIIFQGPHAYVSASWYGHENVSTWNYQAVHVYGKATLLTKEELREDVTLLMETYEHGQKNPKHMDMISPSLIDRQLNGIVGFRLKVDEIQATYKLSQNRTAEDYHSVIKHLEQGDDPLAHQVAQKMRHERSF